MTSSHRRRRARTSLVIVESPAKAKTIGKYLGRGYRVRATVGHIMDLPEKKLGIDIENGFEPELVPIPGKGKDHRRAEERGEGLAAKSSSPPTLIARARRSRAHVAAQIRPKRGAVAVPIKRVLFHEITQGRRPATRSEQAGDIDDKKVEAQQARRVLDRLVGYKASPVLWKTVKKGLSAGRVQTVALRLIVEREREIRAFKPVEYWTIEALLEKDGQQFTAKLHHIDGKKAEIHNKAEAERILDGSEGTQDLRRHRGQASRAPQESGGAVHDVDAAAGSGEEALVRLQAHDARRAGSLRGHRHRRRGRGRSHHVHAYGLDARRRESRRVRRGTTCARCSARSSSPPVPQLYGDEQGEERPGRARERPSHGSDARPDDDQAVSDARPVQALSAHLAALHGVADGAGRVRHDDGGLRHSGRRRSRTSVAAAICSAPPAAIIKFQGFLALYREAREEGDHKALEDEQALPVVVRGRERARARASRRRSTSPSRRRASPRRASSRSSSGSASAVRRRTRRSSRCSPTVATSSCEQRRFFPTELGETVEKVMVKQFPDIFNVGFTSEMEGELDKVEEGELGWQQRAAGLLQAVRRSRSTRCDAGALIAEAHDLSEVANAALPGLRRQARATRRLLRAVPRLREPSEELQVHAPAQGREGEAGDDGAHVPSLRRSRW